MKVSRVARFDEKGTSLYIAVISMVGTKNLGGENLFFVIRDFPHIGGTTIDWLSIDLGQSTLEVMGWG